MNKNLFFSVLCLSSIMVSSCGKYAPPIPPEVLAPKAVYDIEAMAYERGVVLKWKGNTDDKRSKELKTMNGYYVERACLQDDDLLNASIDSNVSTKLDYKVLSIVNDNQVSIREKLREDAKNRGESSRRVKVPSEKLKFNYVDSTIKYNDLCYYKITPFNQGNVRGDESSPIKVKFKGQDSFIIITSKNSSKHQKVTFDN
ncbi:MAG: hypothetical protein SPJ04_03210 [Bdellovibrionota bacterium]|nr:hypothetical protein [Pseudomonadota bacterium]MDY6090246.1 hypothetical protein [Bdellovibrionota bacterium]